ncbi:MAG: site-2 protease family protein [Actinomycetota bacterium]|nr:site-2 protease family protein [Actinomycetota bacterium]
MRETFRLGRIAGINVGMNASVLLVVALIAGGLALGRFPLLFPGHSTAAYVLAGVVAAAAFLGSLLAHEVAHAVVARRNGVEVEGITLWLLGGVARLKGDSPTPGADFRIAGVGPATSLVLAVAFGISAVLWAATAGTGLVLAVLQYLAVINLSLAVFNLIPAAPLDGGRLLRSFLWRRSGDASRAAATSARVGRYFGIGLIAYGVFQLVSGQGLGGLWLAFIGLFIVNAATAEEQHAQMSGRLGGLSVGSVMSGPARTADPDLTVDQFLHEVVLVQRFSTYPLVEADGRLVGLVTLNRLRGVPPQARATTRLRDVACPPSEIPTTTPTEPLTALLPRLAGCTDGRAVVLDAGRVVGVLSPSDIARTLQLADLAAFEPYPASSGGADVSRTPAAR